MARRGTTPSPRELRRRPVPAWWRDAKLGIFIHWTPASVPAFAPTDLEIGSLLANGAPDAMAWSPYTEWYQNSLRFPGSPVAEHHRDTYRDRPYESFAADYEAGLEQWDPEAWARSFRAAGARYVVLVSKHHDGYCLWPSAVRNPHRDGWHTRRDVVGELGEAVRGQGLRFGLYYSGGLDWTFDATPIGTTSDLVTATPRGDYPQYAEAQVRELIERYRPSVLWNDITWPDRIRPLAAMVADYYRAVPEGVINDRWLPWSGLSVLARTPPGRRAIDAFATRAARADKGIIPPRPPIFDVRTPEYTVFDHIRSEPWECVRGIDRSFGYNRTSTEELHLSRVELIGSLCDIAAKGGNLLLNVGPRGEDAQIPERQLRRLEWLGDWTGHATDALYDTRPWVAAGAATADGIEVRYTARGSMVWASVLTEGPGPVLLREIAPTPTTYVTDAAGEPLPWRTTPEGLVVELAASPTSIGQVVGLRDVTALPGPPAPRRARRAVGGARGKDPAPRRSAPPQDH